MEAMRKTITILSGMYILDLFEEKLQEKCLKE
jgi:hypothetical protein